MSDTTETKNISTSGRTEYSDFLVNMARTYLNELNYTPELRQKMQEQKLLIVPFGSVARGTSIHAESKDADFLIITENSPEKFGSLLFDGSLHPSNMNLDSYLMNKLLETKPDWYSERVKAIEEKKVETVEIDAIYVDAMDITVHDMLGIIKSGKITDYGYRDEHRLAMSNWGAVLAVLRRIDPALVMSPIGNASDKINEIRTRITDIINGLPKSTAQEIDSKIRQNYEAFMKDINRED